MLVCCLHFQVLICCVRFASVSCDGVTRQCHAASYLAALHCLLVVVLCIVCTTRLCGVTHRPPLALVCHILRSQAVPDSRLLHCCIHSQAKHVSLVGGHVLEACEDPAVHSRALASANQSCRAFGTSCTSSCVTLIGVGKQALTKSLCA